MLSIFTGYFSYLLFCFSVLNTPADPAGHISVKSRTKRLHEIISQRSGMFPRLMKDSKAGIQAQSKEILKNTGQKDSVGIVEQNIKAFFLSATTEG